MHVAKDFGLFAPEAVMLMAIAGFPVLQRRLSTTSQQKWGIAVLVIAIAWIAWKLVQIPAN